MRFAIDTGGTFTDLVVQHDDGRIRLVKKPTTPDDPIAGVIEALDQAADDMSITLAELLTDGELIFATTRAINAIITGQTARTAFLTTAGHEDILVLREGGRSEPFDFAQAYPEPYVPRRLTHGLRERIDPNGEVVTGLDEAHAREAMTHLHGTVEAVAVCLLWSIANPIHELRAGQLIEEHLPGVAYTLSHQLNPILGEYPRASSTALDASLKPLMTEHLSTLEESLRGAGLTGPVLVVTSGGALMPAAEVASAPIHSLNSGPSMAPLAGRHHAGRSQTAIVADTGGTSYDLSVVRDGEIGRTSETWIGPEYRGVLTGFPSVDVRSIGAGGGSIAWVDHAGLLRVGPQSAGAAPGPACYGRGGEEPTITDAALVLGYLDPHLFLDGTMPLNPAAAERAVTAGIGEELGLSATDAAAAVLVLATEQMVQAIDAVTLHQGIDPGSAVLVAGGGAAGLNSVAIARRLGCERVLFPESGAALSATGALIAQLGRDVVQTMRMRTDGFDAVAANSVLAELETAAEGFVRKHCAHDPLIEYWVQARYPSQSWDLDLRLPRARFDSTFTVDRLRSDFHALHEAVFAVSDPGSEVEITAWRVRAVDTEPREIGALVDQPSSASSGERLVHLPGSGRQAVLVARFSEMEPGSWIEGPAIVESSSTTILVDAEARAARMVAGGPLEVLLDHPGPSAPMALAEPRGARLSG